MVHFIGNIGYVLLIGTIITVRLNNVEGLNIDINDPNVPNVVLPSISKEQKIDAISHGIKKQAEIKAHEETLISKGIVMSPDQPGYLNSATKKLSDKTYQIATKGEISVQATLQISEWNNLTIPQRRYGVIASEGSFSDCFEPLSCDNNTRYRTIDGSCNNLQNPRWGQANTPFIRNIAADYGDGINSPRTSFRGDALPSARIVSALGTESEDDPHRRFTHILMQWGQFLDHDITLTPIVTGEDEHDITCCQNGVIRPASDLHEGCLPINILSNDTFFGPLGVSCMEFIRSAPVESETCTFSARQQMNINSAYIDASNVYGSDDERAEDLREHVGGRLRVTAQNNRDLLPPDDAPEEDCHNTQFQCFKAGDVRVNEQPDLAVMHTVWMREHNRIAEELAFYNPHWDDERLYQESRRIVAAEMQHITYKEWLPKILGRKYMYYNGLTPNHRSYAYDPSVDGSITNEFATAAFRFGHTLIQQFLEGYDRFNNLDLNLQLGDVFFTGDFLYEPSTFDSLIRGLTTQKCQKYDRNINPELTTQLYRGPDAFGLDLIALNIQRGREHGIPSYLAFREACGLFVPRTFSDLARIVGEKNRDMLDRIYTDLEDIDLFIGGILEYPARDALIGETFRCILGNQFERLKYGDRFFYENRDSELTSFSEVQIREIQKVQLSRILCDNGDNIERLPEDAFTVNFRRHYYSPYHHGGHWYGGSGGQYSCSDTRRIRRINLRAWTENI